MEPSQVLDKVLEERRPIKIITRGTAVESVAGMAAAVLAILGLSGVYSYTLLPLSVVVLGMAMIIEARMIIRKFSEVMRELGEARGARITTGGMSIEALAGIAGMTMGLLALLGLNPAVLCAVSVMVYGAAMLFSISTMTTINSVIISGISRNPLVRSMAVSLFAASYDVRVLVGMGTLTLGILSAIGIYPETLGLVGVLAAGGAMFLETFAFSERLTDMFLEPPHSGK